MDPLSTPTYTYRGLAHATLAKHACAPRTVDLLVYPFYDTFATIDGSPHHTLPQPHHLTCSFACHLFCTTHYRLLRCCVGTADACGMDSAATFGVSIQQWVDWTMD